VNPSFLELNSQDLRLLASALRGRRIRAPYSALALTQLFPDPVAKKLSFDLTTLAGSNYSTEQIAFLLETLAQDRERHSDSPIRLELVSSGPEAPGITNRDTRIVVSQLFGAAEQSVIIAGYAVYQGRKVFESLAQRMIDVPKLNVKMLLDVQRRYGETTDAIALIRNFAERFAREEWPGEKLPDVYYDPRSLDLDMTKRASLHAKCIVMDSRMAFISSANFTEAAQLRNIEMGVLVESSDFAKRCEDHFRALINHGLVERVPLG
jgi:phosphatidylserine/phosphatidylglycerophosphate/cardiolipin synthase-like enzyme